MTASPIRAAALALASALLLASLAGAQTDDGQPLSLIPSDDDDRGASALPDSGSQDSPDGLEVEALEAVDTGAVGLLDISESGFGLDMWQGSDLRLVAALLPRIPAGNGSSAATQLAKRLLLTNARLPEGEAGDLLGLRAERLVALGLADDALALIDRAPRSALSGLALGARSEALFLKGRSDEACGAVREALLVSGGIELEQALVFCQRLAGDQAGADLGLSALQDSGVELARSFLAMDAALAAGRRGELDTMEDVTPLVFAMAMASGAEPDPALAATAGPAVARAMAESGLLGMEVRLAAAERAVALGAMPGSEGADLYGEAEFATDDIVNALSRAEAMSGAAGRALLFRAAREQALAAGRAEALAAMLRDAAAEEGAPGYMAAARIAAGELEALSPGVELAWFAADAASALLAAGEPEAAARWWPLLQERAASDPAVDRRVATLWPMFRVAFGEQLPGSSHGMTAWWQAMAERPEERARPALLYLAAFGALEDDAGTAILPELLAEAGASAAAEPPAGILAALDSALRGGRAAETALLCLVALGAGGPAEAHPVTLASVIAALRGLELNRDSRLVALEAAARHGTVASF